eukprot:7312588-Pyramimonas_sp.AAC.1
MFFNMLLSLCFGETQDYEGATLTLARGAEVPRKSILARARIAKTNQAFQPAPSNEVAPSVET